MRKKLIELVRAMHQEELTFIERLTDAERAQVGTPEVWSAKDLLAHITTWITYTMENHTLAMRGETPRTFGDDDHENALIFEAHRDQSWDELRRKIDDLCDRQVAWIQAMSDEDLTNPDQTPWHRGQALWRRIAGDNGTHAMIHLAEYYEKHGRQSNASRMHETFGPLMLSLSDDEEWQGVTIYNLACYHALAGDKTQALSKLAEALRLYPSLVEWSKQDPDLVSLHNDPAYLALYA